MQRPVPAPDQLTQPFWEAANSGKLVIQRCAQCSRYFHPPRGLCPDCLSSELRFEPASGRGIVYSYTVTHDARHVAFAEIQPYAVVIVELEEQPGLVLLSNMYGDDIERLRPGLPVEVAFEEVAAGWRIPQFRIAG